MFFKRRRAEAAQDGCGFLLLTCIFTCLLLVLNCFAVSWVYSALAEVGWEFLRQSRVQQMSMFLAPVALMFLEWWLVDLIVDLVTPRRKA